MSRTSLRLGFTLVELLVVIGIIALLISILLPVLKGARQAAQAVACQSNERQLMMAFWLFSEEHKSHLPGNFVDYQNPDRDKRAWLLNSGEAITVAPQGGTIYKYLKNKEVFRCPAEDKVRSGLGVGTNGQFDYASFGVFTGAITSKIKNLSKYTAPNGKVTYLSTPIICEESEKAINGANMEGLHNYDDAISNVHRGGGYYASTDGSVHLFVEPKGGKGAYNWSSKGPSNKDVELFQGGYGITWGWWNVQ